MATDTNYLGLGVIFRAVDEGFSKTVAESKAQALSATDVFRNLQSQMDGLATRRTVDIQVATEPLEAASRIFASLDQTANHLRERLSKPMSINVLDTSANQTIDRMSERLASIQPSISMPQMSMPRLMMPNFDGFSDGVSESGKHLKMAWRNTRGLEGSFGSLGKEKDSLIGNFGKLDKQLDKSADHLDATGQAAKRNKGFFGSLSGGLKSFANLAMSLAFLGKSRPLQTLLTGGEQIPEYVKGFDDLRQKMARIYDPKMVNEFASANLSNLRNFGVGAADATRMALALNQSQISLEEQKKILPIMGEMVGALGMDANQVANMFGKSSRMLRMLPSDMVSVTKEVNKMGKAYRLLDFTEDLPEVVESVSDSLFKLGRMNRANARQAIESTMAVKAYYQSYGMGAKEATQAAKDFQSKISGMDRSIRRMAAGMDPLSDDIFELMPEIARVTGKSAQDVYKMIQDGALNPEAFQEQLVGIGKGLKGTDSVRFTETIRDLFGPAGDAMANSILNPMDKTVEESKKRLKETSPEDAWKQMMDAAKNTISFQEKMLESNKQLFDIKRIEAIKDAYIQSLKAQTSMYQSLQDQMDKTDSALTKTINKIDALRYGGLAALSALMGFSALTSIFGGSSVLLSFLSVITTTIGSVASGFASFFGVLQKMKDSIKGVYESIAKFAGKMRSKFTKLTSSIKSGFGSMFSWVKSGFGKLFSFILKPIDAIGSRFSSLFSSLKSGVGKGFSLITKPIGAMFKSLKGVGGLLKGFGKLFMKLLGPVATVFEFLPDAIDGFKEMFSGNVTKGIADTLFGKLGDSVGSQAMKWGTLGATIGTFMGGPIGTVIGGAIGAAVGAAGHWLRNNWDKVVAGIESGVEKMGEWIGRSVSASMNMIGGMFIWLGDKVFNKEIWIQRGRVIADAFVSGSNSILDWFSKLPERISSYLEGMSFTKLWEGIKNDFKASMGWMGSLVEKFSASYEKGKQADIESRAQEYLVKKPEVPKATTSEMLSKKPEVPPLPDNVYQFPQQKVDAQKGEAKVVPMESSSRTKEIPLPMPNMNQPGSPGKAALGASYEPLTASMTESSMGSDQGKVLAHLVDIRDGINKLAEKPVSVHLVGDAKKFFKEMANNQRDAAGRRGNANAVG